MIPLPKEIELVHVYDTAHYAANATRSVLTDRDILMLDPTHFEVVIDGVSAIKNRNSYEVDVLSETWAFIFGIEYAFKFYFSVTNFPKVTERQKIIRSPS